MKPLITAAARALAAGDPLRALNLVALNDEAPALALRGIALAQLGDLGRARQLLRRAARAFGKGDVVARARCVVAEAEIALATRDLGGSPAVLDSARAELAGCGDVANAAHAAHLQARRFLLFGRLDEAEGILAAIDPGELPFSHRATHELVAAGIAMRRLRTTAARSALMRASDAAGRSGIAALQAEVVGAARLLDSPAARTVRRGGETLVTLDAVADLFASDELIVDACRRVVRRGRVVVPLAARPVLFALARTLSRQWPGEATREQLVAEAFGARSADDSHRARLRVEIGRLRKLLGKLARVDATRRGFRMDPGPDREVTVLAWPADEEHGAVLAFLADGEAWSSSALALALGVSQRTVQRSLDALSEAGKVQWFGRGRARRWITPSVPGFATILLLPTPVPGC
ncbi:HTH domain-containing protein [Luteolibacter marinus]|uniref:HTH domain-containing protein n=1 Tax=Luteolibacter marinus TaxID=2776705 RepID=UPI0018680B10|nr:HTH domain-containing protein [Luteolibacter marinus]